MTNLGNDVLQALQDGKNLNNVLDKIAKAQDDLLNNYSNPVFSNNDKNKLLKQYNELEELGKSITKYATLKENNYLADAEQEKREIFDKLLNGFITTPKYVWHSEHNTKTCPQCKSLDKSIYYMPGEVPQRPHPNCRCTVETVEEKAIETQKTEQKPQAQTQAKPQETSANTNWILPVAKGHKITSPYGMRMHPVHHRMILHDGIDINATANTPVFAVADGEVSVAGWVSGYGNYIQIEHTNGISTFYAHLNKINIQKGMSVKQGQNIALSGNTGIGTGPHLHFGVKKNKQSADPTKYLPEF